jgi:hypothetical protein
LSCIICKTNRLSPHRSRRHVITSTTCTEGFHTQYRSLSQPTWPTSETTALTPCAFGPNLPIHFKKLAHWTTETPIYHAHSTKGRQPRCRAQTCRCQDVGFWHHHLSGTVLLLPLPLKPCATLPGPSAAPATPNQVSNMD